MSDARTPILNGPYDPPTRYYETDPIDGSLNYDAIREGRRIYRRDLVIIPEGKKSAMERMWPNVNGEQVKARDRHDIAYWMVDDDYDGNNFVVKQVFFCGGDKDEFAKWEKGLESLAKAKTKLNAEGTLRIELDEEAFERLYGFLSHPIQATPGRQIAVRIVSQFGEESMKVLGV